METFEERKGAEDMEKESSALSVIDFLLTSFIFLPHSLSSPTSSSPPFLYPPLFMILTQKDQA